MLHFRWFLPLVRPDENKSLVTDPVVTSQLLGASAVRQADDGGSLVSFGDALLYGGLTFSKDPGAPKNAFSTVRGD